MRRLYGPGLDSVHLDAGREMGLASKLDKRRAARRLDAQDR
jgi:hypothetical protein